MNITQQTKNPLRSNQTNFNKTLTTPPATFIASFSMVKLSVGTGKHNHKLSDFKLILAGIAPINKSNYNDNTATSI
jgi:hypothetical protein